MVDLQATVAPEKPTKENGSPPDLTELLGRFALAPVVAVNAPLAPADPLSRNRRSVRAAAPPRIFGDLDFTDVLSPESLPVSVTESIFAPTIGVPNTSDPPAQVDVAGAVADAVEDVETEHTTVSVVDDVGSIPEPQTPVNKTFEPVELRRSARAKRPPDRLGH